MNTSRPGRRISLLLRLAVTIVGLQCVAVLTVVLFSYVSSEQALLRQSRELLQKDGMNVVERVKAFMDPARQSIGLAKRLSENDVLSLSNPAELESFLFRQLQIGPRLSGMYYGDIDGNFVYVMREAEEGTYRTRVIRAEDDHRTASLIYRNDRYSVLRTEKDPDDTYDPRKRPWFQDAKDTGSRVWTKPYIFYSSQQPGITLSTPVFDGQKRLRGVFGVDLEIDELSVFLSEIWPQNAGAAMIVNHAGDVVAYPSFRYIARGDDGSERTLINIADLQDPLLRPLVSRLEDEEPPAAIRPRNSEFKFEGQRYVSRFVPIGDRELPWLIAVFAPDENFIGVVKDDRVRAIWFAFAVAFTAGLIGVFFANRINRPLRVFSKRTKMISEGKAAPDDGISVPYAELKDAGDTILHEIQQRKLVEQIYGQTFELASRGMVQIEPKTGRFQRVNAQFADMTGYTVEECVSLSISDLLHSHEAELAETFNEAIFSESEFATENQFRRKDGTDVWLRMDAILIRDAAGAPLHAVAMVDDVSETRKSKLRVATLKRELSHLARVNMMGEMASGLAHELNQPLTAIINNVDAAQMMLGKADQTDAELHEALGDVERQARRAGDIIKTLRDLVRKDPGRTEAFNLIDLTNQVISLTTRDLRENAVTVDVQSRPLPNVEGNRTQIAQVLVNLLMNAISAMADARCKRRHIVLEFKTNNGSALVSITDTGPGIADDRRLFDTFETQKPEGMGLGLSICRSIIEAHGGRIWHDSAPGQGARFLFTVPLAKAREEAAG
ncbi:MAG: cache domain-containing protein [Pseudomonadota bacterium]